MAEYLCADESGNDTASDIDLLEGLSQEHLAENQSPGNGNKGDVIESTSRLSRANRPGAARPRPNRRADGKDVPKTQKVDVSPQVEMKSGSDDENVLEQTVEEGNVKMKKRKHGTKSRMAVRPKEEQIKTSPARPQMIPRKASRILDNRSLKAGDSTIETQHMQRRRASEVKGHSERPNIPVAKGSMESPKSSKARKKREKKGKTEEDLVTMVNNKTEEKRESSSDVNGGGKEDEQSEMRRREERRQRRRKMKVSCWVWTAVTVLILPLFVLPCLYLLHLRYFVFRFCVCSCFIRG